MTGYDFPGHYQHSSLHILYPLHLTMVLSHSRVVAVGRSRSSDSCPCYWASHSTERGHSCGVVETGNARHAYSDVGGSLGLLVSTWVESLAVAAAAAVEAIVTVEGE